MVNGDILIICLNNGSKGTRIVKWMKRVTLQCRVGGMEKPNDGIRNSQKTNGYQFLNQRCGKDES